MNEELKMELKKAEHLLCKGLKEITDKGTLSMQSLEVLDKIADIALDISKVTKEEDGMYSRFYDDGYGRRRRDSMGRFTADGYHAGEANGYHRDGYSRDNYGRDSYGEPEREYLDWNLRQAASVLKDQGGR